jgi:septum formation protein
METAAGDRLVLASGSPRRALILRSLGVAFRVVVTNADEALRPGEEAGAAAERLARLKAGGVRGEALPVLAADTLVVCGGRILGKPREAAEAAAMLRLLSGRAHEVVTGVCLAWGERAASGVERTSVRFATLSPEAVDWYVGTGEPMDKAGAYHVDGRGAAFIESIEGSPTNVAGLPVRLVLALAKQLGVELGIP